MSDNHKRFVDKTLEEKKKIKSMGFSCETHAKVTPWYEICHQDIYKKISMNL